MNTVCGLPVDWAATGTMLQGVGTFAGVAAVVIGAKIGANAWKEQKQLEHRMEMAKQITTATYNGRRALGRIRAAMTHGFEEAAATATLQEDKDAWDWLTEAQKKRHVTSQVYLNRINQTNDQQLALDDCLPMARAVFGGELEKAVEKLRHQFWTIYTYAQANADFDETTDPTNLGREIRCALYDFPPREGERSKVTDAITESVAIIERYCNPAFKLEAASEPVRESRLKSLWERGRDFLISQPPRR